MIEIDGKHYKLEEAYVFDEYETDWKHDAAWGETNRVINVATDKIEVKKAFVLVEAED